MFSGRRCPKPLFRLLRHQCQRTLYEVYAVARDNDGNEVVSNVERVVVDESMDTFGDALQLNFSNEVLWGSITSLNSVFKAPEGLMDMPMILRLWSL